MTDIQYLSPRTLDEAISAFAAAGSAARIMAGGTDFWCKCAPARCGRA